MRILPRPLRRSPRRPSGRKQRGSVCAGARRPQLKGAPDLEGEDGAGRAEAGQEGGHAGPAGALRLRRLLQAAPGHLLALRAGGAGPADARRLPQGRRQHEGPGQGLPGRPPPAPHRQGSSEERLGGY